MNVEAVPVGPIKVNCYLVWSDARQALVIDPGGDAPHIADAINEHGLEVAMYLLTHAHTDHIAALAAMYERFPAPMVIHRADAEWAFNTSNQLPPFYGVPRRPAGGFRHVKDGDDLTAAGLDFTVIETPGHTPGCVCYWFKKEGALFAGDLVFAGSIGRTDLPGGNPRDMTASLQRLIALPDDTLVYAGHGPDTTLGDEQRTNPFFSLIRTAAET